MKFRNLYYPISKRASVLNLVIALLIFCTINVSYGGFAEEFISSKWYAFIVGVIALNFIILLGRKEISITIDHTFIVISVFLGYLFFRICIPGCSQLTIISFISFILLYLSFKTLDEDDMEYFPVFIVCACLLQAMYGTMQYVGLFHSAVGFRLTGSFDNPAGIAGCLASGFPFCLSFFRKSIQLKYLGTTCLLVLAVTIILSGSRAGILSITTVSIVYIVDKYNLFFKRYRKCIIMLVISFLFLAIGLIFLKKDSAMGRIFIWKNTFTMIADKPVFGHGSASFPSEYMLYQANYFSHNSESDFIYFSDNVSHPFNEFLLLVAENGIIALFLLFICIFVIVSTYRWDTTRFLPLLSIVIFASFSYPLRYPFIMVVTTYCLARYRFKEKKIFTVDRYIRAVFLFISLAILLFSAKDMKFEYGWGKLVDKTAFGKTKEYLGEYEKLYEKWNRNPLFLYNLKSANTVLDLFF